MKFKIFKDGKRYGTLTYRKHRMCRNKKAWAFSRKAYKMITWYPTIQEALETLDYYHYVAKP